MAKRAGRPVNIDVADLRMQITANNRHYEFLPQFVLEEEGRIKYLSAMASNVVGMIGWLPYFNRRWPEGFDKLAFKAAMRSSGQLVPPHWLGLDESVRDVLIKHPRHSFGYGMRGPFTSAAP